MTHNHLPPPPPIPPGERERNPALYAMADLLAYVAHLVMQDDKRVYHMLADLLAVLAHDAGRLHGRAIGVSGARVFVLASTPDSMPTLTGELLHQLCDQADLHNSTTNN